MNRRHRRAVAALERRGRMDRLDPFLTTRDPELAKLALEIVTSDLKRYGNTLTEDHARALGAVVCRFSDLAAGYKTGRYGYALPCGAGKTQAVVSWIAACHRLDRPYTVAVAASQVEALCEIKRKLIARGVPEAKIGLLHSYNYDPERRDPENLPEDGRHASEPATSDNDDRPYLLLTHSRIRAGNDESKYAFRGGKRDLVIWDESLLTSEHREVRAKQLRMDIAALKEAATYPTKDATLSDLVAWLIDQQKRIERNLNAQRGGAKPLPMVLTALPEATAVEWSKIVLEELRQETSDAANLISLNGFTVRAFLANQSGGGYVQYRTVVPPSLDRMAILDASFHLRRLQQLDPSIKRDLWWDHYGYSEKVKRYEDVTIYWREGKSGRRTVEADLKARDKSTFARQLVRTMRDIPDDEGVLIVTFKQRGRKGIDIEGKLRAALKAAGIDTDAVVIDPNETDKKRQHNPRIRFLTWGRETGTNEFAYIPNVIFMGVMERSESDLAGEMVGQADDLIRPIDHEELIAFRRSEVAHVVYQALSRAACRNTDNGRALATKVYLQYRDPEVLDMIREAMPGVRVEEWAYGEQKQASKTRQLSDRIVAYLKELPKSIRQVSLRKLKSDLEPELTSTAFKRARDSALDVLEDWRLTGRSLIRT